MKKICLLMVLLALLLVCTSALANGAEVYSIENMPPEIKTMVDESQWSGWEITGWVNPSGIRNDNACAFAVVKNGSQNDLLAFGWDEGGWRYKWHNPSALPQVKAPILLGELEKSTGFQSFYVVNNETMESNCIWVQKRDGAWHLEHMRNYYPLMFFDTSFENALRLYNTGWTDQDIDVWVYGTYQKNLQYFDLAAFPKTVEEAREKLSDPAKILLVEYLMIRSH